MNSIEALRRLSALISNVNEPLTIPTRRFLRPTGSGRGPRDRESNWRRRLRAAAPIAATERTVCSGPHDPAPDGRSPGGANAPEILRIKIVVAVGRRVDSHSASAGGNLHWDRSR